VVYNHNTYISHSRTIVNRNNFHSASFSHSSNFRGGDFRGGNFGDRWDTFQRLQRVRSWRVCEKRAPSVAAPALGASTEAVSTAVVASMAAVDGDR
jgi:hypothetical protein